MPPKSSNDKSSYKKEYKVDLEKLKNGDLQKVKVDLTNINIKTIAKRIGALSEDVKMYMYLPTAKRYYALNDRTTNLLMKGKIDMSATNGDDETDNPIKFSDVEAVETVHKEKEVEMFIVDKNKTRAGGSFFPYLNITIFDLSKYGVVLNVDRKNYRHNCLYLALQAGGLSDTKLQELILTLRNRHIHKFDLSNVCNALETNIELILIRTDGKKQRC